MGDEPEPLHATKSVATARDRLEEAARRLLAGATLDDLSAFVTVNRLTEHSGLSSGAVYSAFSPGPGIDSRTRTAPQEVARAAFRSLDPQSDEMVEAVHDSLGAAIAQGESEGLEFLLTVAEMLVAPITAAARGLNGDDGWSYTHLFLGAATALNDPEVAEFLSRAYEEYDRVYEPGLEVLLRLSGRVLIDGVDIHQLSQMLISVGDACALRSRVAPNTDPSIMTRMYVAIWVAMTRRVDARDDQLGHRLAILGQDPLGDEESEAVRAAVLRVTSRAGWPAVTLAKVAQLAGISDTRLVGVYPSRHDLSVIVWADLIAGVRRRDAARSEMPSDVRLATLLEDICDTACSQRALTASLLIAHLSATSDLDTAHQDPGSDLVVELLAAAISAVAADRDVDLTGPAAPTAAGDGFRVMARATLDLVLLRASTSRVSGSELTSLIVDGMVGAGVVIDDPASHAGGSSGRDVGADGQ